MQQTPKIKEVRQTEVADCGLACLVMIFEYHGVNCNVEYFKERYSIDSTGLSLLDLYRITQEHGFSARGLQVPLDEISSLTLPAIAHWGGNHFVVLEKFSDSKVVVVDPAFGRTTHSIEYVKKLLSGIYLEIHRNPGAELAANLKAQKVVPSILNFISHNPTLWPTLSITLLALALLQFIELASPYFVSLVVDKSLGEQDKDALWLIVFAFSGLFASKIVMSFISNRLISNLEYSYGYGIANFFSTRVLRSPFSFFLKRSATDLHSRLLGADSARTLISGGLLSAPFNSIYIIAAVGLMFYMAAIPALIVLIILLIVIAVEFPLQRWIYSLQKEYAHANSAEHSTIATVLLRIEHSKLNSTGLYDSMRIDDVQLRKYKSLRKVQVAMTDSQTIVESVELMQKLVLVLVLGSLVLEGKLTIGLAIAFLMLADEAKGRLIGLVKFWSSLRAVQVMMERVADLVASSLDADAKSIMPNKVFEQAPMIEMKSVDYAFSSLKDPVIRNFNLTINPGDKVLFFGPSGSGKSTLLRLLAGLIDPVSGSVLVDEGNIKEPGIKASYNQIIGGVCASPRLIDGTVYSNLVYGVNYSDEKYYSLVISALSLDMDFRDVPGGFNSLISGDGQGVSTGQSQRIQLANVLLRRPKILVLDEPTAHCDSAASTKIVRFLETYPGTVIVATHDSVFFDSKFKKMDVSGRAI